MAITSVKTKIVSLRARVSPYAHLHAAYCAGGQNNSGTVTKRIERIAFTTDTKVVLNSNLRVTTYTQSGFANSGTAGYSAGGYINYTGYNGAQTAPGYDSKYQKLPFSSETLMEIGNYSYLQPARGYAAAPSNNGVAAYLMGGYEGNTYQNVIDKFFFTVERGILLSATLSVGTFRWAGGFSNSGTAGYAAGGTGTATFDTKVDKITYSTDVRTAATALPAGRRLGAGFANSGTAGYCAGGDATGTTYASIVKILFSTDATSTLANSMSAARQAGLGAAKNGAHAYIFGGYNGSADTSSIDKFVFSSETSSAIAATLTDTSENQGVFANCGTF